MIMMACVQEKNRPERSLGRGLPVSCSRKNVMTMTAVKNNSPTFFPRVSLGAKSNFN